MQLIQYTTKTGQAVENRARIEAVFAALREARLADFSYMVVEAGEGEFFHIVETTPAAPDIFRNLPAFRDFSTTVGDRQVAPSNKRDARVVGSYGRLTQE
jgi:hypothetical protein